MTTDNSEHENQTGATESEQTSRRAVLRTMAGAGVAGSGLLAASAAEPADAGKGSLGGHDGTPCD